MRGRDGYENGYNINLELMEIDFNCINVSYLALNLCFSICNPPFCPGLFPLQLVERSDHKRATQDRLPRTGSSFSSYWILRQGLLTFAVKWVL